MSVVESILKHEGFRSKPYPDPIHGWEVPTFGHGLTFITEQESISIVETRVQSIATRLSRKREVFSGLPPVARDTLIEMAYQMGVEGVNSFNNMWKALDRYDFDEAAEQMLDSKWAKQTPGRAQELAARMAGLA